MKPSSDSEMESSLTTDSATVVEILCKKTYKNELIIYNIRITTV